MPRYNPSIGTASAGVPLLPKDDYVFEISAGKTFINNQGTPKENHGVRYAIKIISAGGEGSSYVGKSLPFTLYGHSEAALGMVKQFLMCALGYPVNTEGEEAFNLAYADADYSYDTESGEMGEIYHKVAGCNIAATVDVKARKDDPTKEQNQFSWRPVGS